MVIMSRDRLVAIYDGDCGFCQASLNLLSRRFALRHAQYVPYQSISDSDLAQMGLLRQHVENALCLYDASQRLTFCGPKAFHRLLEPTSVSATLARFVERLPFLLKIEEYIYLKVVRNRHTLSRIFRTTSCRLQR